MKNIVPYSNVEKKIITIRGQKALLDSDVAELYGVETKRVNEALKNNPDKFPSGYVLCLTDEEMRPLRSKFSTLEKGRGKYSKYNANVFTEKGLYMLATILKSPRAAETTIAIVETFVKFKYAVKQKRKKR
ncbi:putative ORF6N domain protein [Candidatus Termititenax aidoneus]|uniref:ORF6N domain protein n=1 Tax=Termititenax aidoneus TaxID=2218524 RepID=A0A388TAN2_TERA1|nr:putative ORF6N domain protein [Candidatus Termititenax aidoneus]